VLSVAASGEAAAPLLLATPDDPGPNEPPAGESLFDEVFAHGGGTALPYPFERLLEALGAATAPAKPVTVLLPLGRSLQRFGASPDYFASPRVVVAAAADAGAPGRPLLKDRLFLGFQERAQTIEVISHNEAAGRFEFQVVENYGLGLTPRVVAADRATCVACHQAHGPIFPAALWSETNANPLVADRLAPLGARFNGAPVRGGVDQAEALDAATDRAARFAFAEAIWSMGCAGEAPAAARCRGDLLLNALLFRLAGSRPEGTEPRRKLEIEAARQLRRAAPSGLGAPSPDLPNRDPLSLVLAGATPDDAIEPDGVFHPLHPRAPLLFLPAATGGAALSIEIAAVFADADILWLDRALAARADAQPGAVRKVVGTVEASALELDDGRRELRLASAGGEAGSGLQIAGHLVVAGSVVTGGVIRLLGHDGATPARWLEAAGGRVRSGEAGPVMEVELREAALGLAARFPSGERVLSLELRFQPDGSSEVEIAAVDDLAPLHAAVETLVAAAAVREGAALGAGPLRRRAVLRALEAALAPG
jgi:hypothetical protein